ncbi:MAG TPA: hypothetical protein VHV08_06290, partial [Pirellulales bacterium]|nr:hypothetical protein [Pirellulales bacterium]
MADPQGLAYFPGINSLIEASLVLNHGISPSVATLTIAPQAELNTEIGTLEFAFGSVTLTFPDCKLDCSTYERTASGEVWRLSLLDRRWKWRFGQISGSYNCRRDDFSLDRGEHGSINTERTPQELATLCLQAMGEAEFDVGDLPNDARPSVEWNYDVPAEALAALCDQLGCRVVLQLDNKVAIRRAGQGAALPSGEYLENAMTLDLPELPDTITVVGGANRYQVDFRLEAVGLAEQDPQGADTFVPIDQLSYSPPGGWSRIDLPYFHQVDKAFRALAQKSVYKYYRIQTPHAIPGYDGPQGNQVETLEPILPIEDEQVATATENGQSANLPACVFGVWFPDTSDVTNTATALAPAPTQAPGDGGSSLATLYRGRYTIDTARGLVIFDEPVYRNVHPSANGGSGYEVVLGAAQLVLRAACRVRDPKTLALNR